MPLTTAASPHAVPAACGIYYFCCLLLLLGWALTSSPAQYPWRGKRLRTASSTRYPSDSSCSPCLPSAGYGGGFGACAQLPYHVSYCITARRRRLDDPIQTDHNPGHRLGRLQALCARYPGCTVPWRRSHARPMPQNMYKVSPPPYTQSMLRTQPTKRHISCWLLDRPATPHKQGMLDAYPILKRFWQPAYSKTPGKERAIRGQAPD